MKKLKPISIEQRSMLMMFIAGAISGIALELAFTHHKLIFAILATMQDGSRADWASAAGTTAAAIVAVYFGLNELRTQNRRAKDLSILSASGLSPLFRNGIHELRNTIKLIEKYVFDDSVDHVDRLALKARMISHIERVLLSNKWNIDSKDLVDLAGLPSKPAERIYRACSILRNCKERDLNLSGCYEDHDKFIDNKLPQTAAQLALGLAHLEIACTAMDDAVFQERLDDEAAAAAKARVGK